MNFEIGGMEDAKKWLTSDEWIVFDFGGGDFAEFLEYNYFEPGIPKNADFETLMLPEKGGVSFWFRIKDTEENRENLRKALAEFYGPVAENIDEEIELMQREIKKIAANLEGKMKLTYKGGLSVMSVMSPVLSLLTIHPPVRLQLNLLRTAKKRWGFIKERPFSGKKPKIGGVCVFFALKTADNTDNTDTGDNHVV